ncbi:MAG: hypothetical protein KY469_10600 [Actinobacteria bacterium]|nr:hypothetical protein [Actinomycetota bacterium]
MSTCDARCMAGNERAGTSLMVIECGQPSGHRGFHEGAVVEVDGVPTPTRVSWDERDRRTFRGSPLLCGMWPWCVLPDGHPGRHAT